VLRLDGRVAVVTGGSRGIGRSIAQTLARQGAHVVVNYASNEAAALEVVGAIESAGGRAEALRFDVAQEQAVIAGCSAGSHCCSGLLCQGGVCA
jgi:3-oxoacyl-[acyl-carrier protein] reductase